MDRLVRARVLLAEAEALGVTLDDLVTASAGSSGPVSSAPTLAEYVETVAPSFTEGTAATYRSYWRVAVARYGDRPVDAIDADDCEVVLADAVRRAQQRRPGSDGRSSRENCVAALRALFGRAERAGLVTRNPAKDLDKPRRRESRRRALDDAELHEAIDAVRTTSQDPDLDLLLVRFHLESGARREGALNLRLGDLDARRSTAWLREKFGLEGTLVRADDVQLEPGLRGPGPCAGHAGAGIPGPGSGPAGPFPTPTTANWPPARRTTAAPLSSEAGVVVIPARSLLRRRSVTRALAAPGTPRAPDRC